MKLLQALAVLLMVAVSGAASMAQVMTPEETGRLDAARRKVEAVDKERIEQAKNFNGLLELRDRLDPVIEDVNGVINALQERLNAARARLAEFGPTTPPPAVAPPAPTSAPAPAPSPCPDSCTGRSAAPVQAPAPAPRISARRRR